MNVPISISIAFILISFTTTFIFYLASSKNKKVLVVITVYLLVQGLLAYLNFYSVQPLNPIKVPVAVMPSFALLFYALFTATGKKFIQSLNLKTLTLIHTIRIPVELLLFMLFTHNAIPEIMTFEGRNFDILAGITAPIIYYFTFIKKVIGRKGLLIWNIISLCLLINIIISATLSLEIPIQQYGFDQPNKAIRYFPFIWLPSVVVPLVFFSHCASIQSLLKSSK